MPKVFTYTSASKLNERAVFNKASKHIRSKYGVVLEMADVNCVSSEIDKKQKNKLKRFINKVMDSDPTYVMREGSDRFINLCIKKALDNPYFSDISKDVLEDVVTPLAIDIIKGDEDEHIRQANSFNDYLSSGIGGMW